MASEWKILREAVAIADLASTDINMSGLQTEPAAPNEIDWAAPIYRLPDSGDTVTEWAFVAHAYDNSGTHIVGTCDLQVVERSTWPAPPAPGSNQRQHYVADVLYEDQAFGKRIMYKARYISKVTVTIASVAAVGATKIDILYRQLR